ncbi:MAG: hypothetical protein FRX48_03213 [Lasallia pustulata]|uniref:Zn(2)-C6 fungal-type domain-containing protein n=1 Tax=Lasallia pustulata TaxID=136370 RepID=A0A5M8PX16_9LECA|nr:MAG: hypothetical protein FRX48_03213 [Lasallia pustulata]
MEGIGPEGKRPRLDSYGGPALSHRMQQQPSETPLHNYSSHALPPPNAYTQPPPPSPYHDVANTDHRSLPEPAQHGYTHITSGFNTPVRDARSYPPDTSYSRHGSVSAPTRSPDDIQQLAQLRPLNTASANEGHHYPQHPQLEHGGSQAGYATYDMQTNGNVVHSLPMAGQNDSGHGHSHYSPVNTPSFAQGQGPFSAPPNNNATWLLPKKKNSRAQQACDACRNRKAKCDEGRPSCSFCKEQAQACVYREVAPAKADRANQAILDSLQARSAENTELRARIDRLESKVERGNESIDRLEQFLIYGKSPLKKNHHVADENPENQDIKSSASVSPERKPTQAQLTIASRINPYAGEEGVDETDRDLRDTTHHVSDVTDTNVAAIVDASIIVEHTTAAHRLLRWPSIKSLLEHRGMCMSEDYVMESEEKKGILRPYGRGQGRDTSDVNNHFFAGSPAASSTSARSEESIRSSPSPPDGLWGASFPINTARIENHPGGLNVDGTLKIDPRTLHELLDSYLNNIHIMHPFMEKTRLMRMVDHFAARYNVSDATTSPFPTDNSTIGPDGRRDPAAVLNKATKRKYSNGSSMGGAAVEANSVNRSTTKPLLERSISTAIVLLVMALGKICAYPKPLPGALKNDAREAPSAVPRSFSPHSPMTTTSLRASPTSTQASPYNVTMSPRSTVRMSTLSRRSSAEDIAAAPSGMKNADQVPGLAYFAQATDILGNLHAGNELPHVQAFLLAGLYAGQLACTIESWSWIFTACRACRILVRDLAPNRSKQSSVLYKDLIAFAYWTCLQLESDILAELDLPRSNIDLPELQELVPKPKGIYAHRIVEDAETRVMMLYSSQILLRKTLNDIQEVLYQVKMKAEGSDELKISPRKALEENLQTWRDRLPPELKWQDGDPPSPDINEARLRAKYYGALYIIHRPSLHYALHQKSPRDSTSRPTQPAIGPAIEAPNYPYRSRGGNMAPPRTPELDPGQAEILRSAGICIQAAMWSTVAFDGIQKRLMVTNIFCTAHAQFGNMLVLAATYRSHLGYLVPYEELARLLERTITFLRRLRDISKTLEQDCMILEAVNQVVNQGPTQSFSSTE